MCIYVYRCVEMTAIALLCFASLLLCMYVDMSVLNVSMYAYNMHKSLFSMCCVRVHVCVCAIYAVCVCTCVCACVCVNAMCVYMCMCICMGKGDACYPHSSNPNMFEQDVRLSSNQNLQVRLDP